MKSPRSRFSQQLNIAFMLLFACIVAGCADSSVGNGSASAVATALPTDTIMPAQATPNPTSTAVSNYPPTPDPLGKEKFETAVAESDNELSTQVALTHAPADTPGPPPLYPTEAPILGMYGSCTNTNSYVQQCYNGWLGMVNGQLFNVMAGRKGHDDNPSQGIIMVSNEQTHAFDTYLTPQILGPVELISEQNLQFTLAVVPSVWTTATPGTTLVFDLTTRQWISPTPIPSISPLPTSMSSP